MDVTTGVVLAWIHLAAGLVLIGLSVPLWLEKIPMNRWYGYRIPQAYASDEAWYRLNRICGKAGVVCGALIAAVGIYCFFSPPQTETAGILLMAITPLIVLVLVVVPLLASREP